MTTTTSNPAIPTPSYWTQRGDRTRARALRFEFCFAGVIAVSTASMVAFACL